MVGRIRRRWLALVAASGVGAAVLAGVAAPSPAAAENIGTNIVGGPLTNGYLSYPDSGNNTFYLYAKAGEWIEVWAEYRSSNGTLNSTGETVTIVAPDGTTTKKAYTSADSRTPFQVTDATAGIWSLTFDTATGGYDPKATRWAISVYADEPEAPNGDWGTYNPITGDPVTTATRLSGRVWSENYLVRHNADGDTNNLRFYLVNDSGYLYELTLNGFNGLNSAITATSLGVPDGGNGSASCTPSYRSWNQPAATVAAPDAPCADNFRIFFEQPNDDLPASAAIWDAVAGEQRSQTLKPEPFDPAAAAVGDWNFTRTVPGQAAGDLSYDLGTAYGSHELQLDLNGNGSYTDPEDRTVTLKATGEPLSYHFDGKDALGATLATCQPVNARIYFGHVGEIHVVQADVEKRGSLVLTRLNGPEAGDSTVYWDDSALTGSRTNTTPVLDGTAGIASSGGVHGWGGSTAWASNGWGNERWIDDWAYLTADTVVGTYSIPTGCDPTIAIDPEQPTTHDGIPLFHPRQDITVDYECVAGSTGGTAVATPPGGGAAVTGTVTDNGDGSCTVTLPPLSPNGAWTLELSLAYGSVVVASTSAIYIDPSGIVVDEQHALVEGATVTLWRSDTEDGTYVQVPNGSLIMSAANRSNPSTTGADGAFSWDVTGGWYRITASKTVDGVTYTGSTGPMQVPPARTGLVIVLHGLNAPPRLAETGYDGGSTGLVGGLLLLALGATLTAIHRARGRLSRG